MFCVEIDLTTKVKIFIYIILPQDKWHSNVKVKVDIITKLIIVIVKTMYNIKSIQYNLLI